MKVLMALVLFAVCAQVIPNLSFATAPADQVPWGGASDGIEMSLVSTDPSGHGLQVSFQNVGDRDVTLNLGYMMANAKVQLPSYIRLKFTDASERERLFEFADLKHSTVAGRLDDYIVPLRAGSIYTLKLRLDQFWCQETKEFEIPLVPGENHLTAQFEGRGAKFLNLDTTGMKHMNFWLGKVESNSIVIKR